MKVGDICEYRSTNGDIIKHGDLVRVLSFMTSSITGNSFAEVWPDKWDKRVPSMFRFRQHSKTGRPFMRLHVSDLVVVGNVCMFNEGGDAS